MMKTKQYLGNDNRVLQSDGRLKFELEEFNKKHCALCGTQRCGGVYDEDFREGCSHYQHEILKQSKRYTT